jgi:hypothetical protein
MRMDVRLRLGLRMSLRIDGPEAGYTHRAAHGCGV